MNAQFNWQLRKLIEETCADITKKNTYSYRTEKAERFQAALTESEVKYRHFCIESTILLVLENSSRTDFDNFNSKNPTN